MTANTDRELIRLVSLILQGDAGKVPGMIAASPGLATSCFQTGASRTSEEPYFLAQIGKYIYAGDTALHIAAAAYQVQIVEQLIGAGGRCTRKKSLRIQPASRRLGRWSGLAIVEPVAAGGYDSNACQCRHGS
jgi:hypothetical protein